MNKIVSYWTLRLPSGEDAVSCLNGLYQDLGLAYPKFFKMDLLSKAGFLAAEKVLSEAGLRNDTPKEDVSIAIVNSSSSTCDDVAFQKSISGDFYPSPSLFVYTLSNIVCGEIAIRNRIKGETSFYVDKSPSAESMMRYAGWAFRDKKINWLLLAWAEVHDSPFHIAAMLVGRNCPDGIPFDLENVARILDR